jgi:putative MFS transporter
MSNNQDFNKQTVALIVVAALGYFVDIYDLILFNVVKKESLISLGISDPLQLKNIGMSLFNYQMGGMLVGGLLWGILGDKKGRLKVLFGSILMYSLANLVNAFVTDIETYKLVRFLAGVGLAGELGAGITLVSEVMSKKNRGWGTMIIVTFGALGAVLAALVGQEGEFIGNIIQSLTGVVLQNWQVAYVVGGLLGLMLLMLRLGTVESHMYKNMQTAKVAKGNFLSIFKKRDTTIKYFSCIAIGLPVWFAIGILVALSESLAKPEILNVSGSVINGQAIMYSYLGLSVGDLLSGILSQIFKSRKKVVLLYMFFSFLMILVYFFTTAGKSEQYFYFICFLVGAGTGYWALFVTIAAEQFGTNIRSTVTNTVPNFVRGSVIPITASFKALEPAIGTVGSALFVGTVCIGLATWATYKIEETFGKELNYHEAF